MLENYSQLIARQIVYVIGAGQELRAVIVRFRDHNYMHVGNLAVDPESKAWIGIGHDEVRGRADDLERFA